MMVIVTSDGLDRHRPVIGMKSYGEKADRKKAGMFGVHGQACTAATA
jgi:hypothetical protein